MHRFAFESYELANRFEDVCSRLKQKLYNASSYMQDDSGQEAISIVSDLIEETMTDVNRIRTIAERVNKSAELLEVSDSLL